MTAPALDDMISRLRSDEGHAYREQIRQRLNELGLRVRAAQDAGQQKTSFEDLEAVRLAVAACHTTLDRLDLKGFSGDRGPLHTPTSAAPAGPPGRTGPASSR